ncbi:restriction endonuclease subunit S [Xanthomarina sp. F2636L]|uniref:restriction endonuclease subunit S n=1 Tax=Xanthomarina sp. F2636L TaxID=2996018 RepID=UPI00225E6D20|nr:restriction endonuclease subunit S [Xanthomarina sp. F2636L]MCX7550275.1 restriction endonuclease subunit S [Xanthomarina sp. F2636L]
MNNNWKTYKLSEVTTKIGSGATPRGGKEAYKDSGVSLIRSQNVLDYKFSTDGLAFIDDKQASKLNNVAIEENDVLLNITGDSVARVCSVPNVFLPARVNQHVAIIRADNKLLDANYLKYSLLEISNKNLLLTLASAGATRNALTKSMIEDFELNLPKLPEQKAIAKILSAIDDKIENNLAINKTLEDMAMALYKHWFVDFGPFQDGEFVDSELGEIPKGWEVKVLGDFVNHQKGFAFKSKWYQDHGELVVRVSDTTHNSINVESCNKISTELASKHIAYSLDTDDVIIATVGSWPPNYSSVVGKVVRVPKTAEGGLLNQNAVRLKMNIDNEQHQGLLYCTLKNNRFLNYIVNSAQGSASQASIKLVDIFEYPIPFGGIEIFNKFSNLIESNISEQNALILENQTLTKLRDTLLSKLISGEVRLKKFKKEVESIL